MHMVELDSQVIEIRISKFYSILPRLQIDDELACGFCGEMHMDHTYHSHHYAHTHQ